MRCPRAAACYSPVMPDTETAVDARRWHLDVADMTPGTRVDGVYGLLNPQVSASRNGNPFLKCMLRDASGRVNGRKWTVEPALLEAIGSSAFAHVSGSCENFNEQIQVRIESIEPAEVDDEDLRRLLPASTRPPAEMLAELRSVMATLSNPAARALADAYFADDSFVERFMRAPAAISMHHAYLGGLLEHTLSLVKSANAILPLHPELDRDLVLLGLMLHDTGKVLELDSVRFEYTRRGNLLGHLVDGVIMLETYAAKARQAGGPPLPPDAKLALQHIIASHHNRPEHGSIKMPASPEAVFVSRLDDLDAATRMALDAVARDGSETGFTEPVRGLGDVRMYRPTGWER
jgi:3'-5' exoribonuclease